MNLKDKYCSEKDKALPENINKTAITNEAYAQCEMISELINKIELLRMTRR